jgi:hypothetical protein
MCSRKANIGWIFGEKMPFHCIGARLLEWSFSDTMSDFAKFIAQKELVYLLKLTLHRTAIECKEGLCISRLVDFELLLELKFEQKK